MDSRDTPPIRNLLDPHPPQWVFPSPSVFLHMIQKASSHEILAAAPLTADGIAVHCKHDALVAAADLKLYPGNYRKHPAKQLDRMHAVISGKGGKPGNGWRRCAVVSTLSGCVTKGNGMVQMARRHGLQVPVEYQTYATKRDEIRDLVADNRLAALANDDESALRKLVAELEPDEVEFTGVSTAEIEALIKDAEIPAAEFPITAKLHERYDYVLIMTTNETDFAFLQTLCGVDTERSYKKDSIGIGRAISFERFIKTLRENYHSLNVPGQDHDHSQAGSGRPDLRP